MTIFMVVLTLTFFLEDQGTMSLIVVRELTLLETLNLKRIQQLVTAKYWGSPSIFVPPTGSYFLKSYYRGINYVGLNEISSANCSHFQ